MTTAGQAAEQLPDFDAGVAYWANTSADVRGVLGGYDETTSVPRLDATSSRLMLLSLMPELSTITPPHRTAPSDPTPKRSFRALDCGAGIGRVTSTVLLPLFHRVDLVEPVPKFVEQAKSNALRGKEGWKQLTAGGKGVRLWRAGLQFFDPAAPAVPVPPLVAGGPKGTVELFATLGDESLDWPDASVRVGEDGAEDGYDLVMVQWCIGHLSDSELSAFLRRGRKSLRDNGYIMLKENVCKDLDGEGSGKIFDDEDSSVTRSDKVFRKIFADADLTIIRREVQKGFPKELFPVISYVLR